MARKERKYYRLTGKPKLPADKLESLFRKTYGNSRLSFDEAHERFNHAVYRWELATRKKKRTRGRK